MLKSSTELKQIAAGYRLASYNAAQRESNNTTKITTTTTTTTKTVKTSKKCSKK